jgi:hypothetical protein
MLMEGFIDNEISDGTEMFVAERVELHWSISKINAEEI